MNRTEGVASKIVIRTYPSGEMSTEYRAEVLGRPSIYAEGGTRPAAIGELIRMFPNFFNIDIQNN